MKKDDIEAIIDHLDTMNAKDYIKIERRAGGWKIISGQTCSGDPFKLIGVGKTLYDALMKEA